MSVSRRARRTISAWVSSLAVAVVIATAVVFGVPLTATAFWTAQASIGLGVPAASFGVTVGAATAVSAARAAGDAASATAIVAFEVGAAEGSVASTRATLQRESLTTSAGEATLTGYAVVGATSDCASAALTSATLADATVVSGLAGMSNGQRKAVCVGVRFTGLPTAAVTATVRLSYTAVVGQGAGASGGWSATNLTGVASVSVAEAPITQLSCAQVNDGQWWALDISGVDLSSAARVDMQNGEVAGVSVVLPFASPSYGQVVDRSRIVGDMFSLPVGGMGSESLPAGTYTATFSTSSGQVLGVAAVTWNPNVWEALTCGATS